MLFLVDFEQGIRVMVFNTTFNKISVISWRSGYWLEETGVPRENHLQTAFDTVEWPFIEKKTLEWYGFGPSFRKWIKSFCTDIANLQALLSTMVCNYCSFLHSNI